MYKKFIKRAIDIILSLILIIVLSPLFILVSVIVRTKLGKPIIFKQMRPGKGGRLFELKKFRSMSDEILPDGSLAPDSIRLSKFGKLLRSTSLDELPELFNILVGEMSFIGPRPLLKEYQQYYNEYHKRRQEVRPGLSGLAQVSGRNSISWKERFDLDIRYVDELSFILDIKIFFLTIKKIVVKEGITFKNNQTIYEYLLESKEETQ